MLNQLAKILPLTKVVIFGYDFTNFIATAECIALAQEIFGPRISQLIINDVFLSYGENVLKSLVAVFPLQLTYTPMWGILQLIEPEGILAPIPNINFPSPYNLMNDGCIHASQKGWELMMTQLYTSYFASRL